MSGGPIDRARRGRLTPPATTNPSAATHAVGDAPRSYCGRARVTLTTDPAAVTCSDCLAALAADEQAASSRRDA